jgi:hypothetical protein
MAALPVGSKRPFWFLFFTTRSFKAQIAGIMECSSHEKKAQHPNTPGLQYSGRSQQSML